MAGKSLPFSVRLPHEDAEFIAGRHIDGAKTPSGKMRSIILDAALSEKRGADDGALLRELDGRVRPHKWRACRCQDRNAASRTRTTHPPKSGEGALGGFENAGGELRNDP